MEVLLGSKACTCFGAVFLFATGAHGFEDCPAGMVHARKGVCIDVYEWPNVPGERPLLAASGEPEALGSPLDADMLCLSVGKRVCTRTEWVSACRGSGGSPFPYGKTYDAAACNTGARWREVNSEKVAKRDKDELARLDQSAPAGSFTQCISAAGAYDMVGNAEEWVTCDDGVYGWCLVGGYWASKQASCDYRIITHAPVWHYYETSFRCCLDLAQDDC